MHHSIIAIQITLSVFITGISFSQTDFDNYVNIESKGEIPEDFISKTYEKIDFDLNQDNREISKKDYRIFLEGIHYGVDDILHSGLVIYSDPLSNYIEEIVGRLLLNNPDLRSELRFYTIKSNEVNAFSTSQGIIFVTTGLLSHVTSEAQLAYVLAHEISHYTEKHVVKAFTRRKEINKGDDQIKQLSVYSKNNEFEADKFAVKMYHDAGYSKEEIFLAFEMLKHSKLAFAQVEFPVDYYNDDFAFIPESMFDTKANVTNQPGETNGRMSTHPNIDKRKDSVSIEINNFSDWKENKFISDDRTFFNIQKIARFESVWINNVKAKFADALYAIFLLEKENPNSKYLSKQKCIAWMGILNFKNADILSKAIKSRNQMFGEEARLHKFIKGLHKRELATLVTKEVYKIHQKLPNDEEINFLYSQTIKSLSKLFYFKIDDYSQLTFHEALTSVSGNDSIEQSIDSSDFYLYSISNVISDSSFVNDFNIERSKSIVEHNSSDESKKALDIEKLMIVEPIVFSYNKNGINRKKSEHLEDIFLESISYSAELKSIEVGVIDRSLFLENGTTLFNERAILYNALIESLNSNETTSCFSDQKKLNKLKEKYETSKVMFSLVEHYYRPEISGYGVLSRMEFFPIIPYYLAKGIYQGNHIQLSVFILDLETGKIEFKSSNTFSNSISKWYMSAHMYNVFNTIEETTK